VCRPDAPTDTFGRISSVYIRAAQNPRNSIYRCLTLIWCVRTTLNLHLMVFVLTNPSGGIYTLDFLAFSLIIFLAAKSEVSRLGVPNILRTIAEDATRYFLVIFSSHFVLEMTLSLARVSATAVPLPPAANDIQCMCLGIHPTPSGYVSHR